MSSKDDSTARRPLSSLLSKHDGVVRWMRRAAVDLARVVESAAPEEILPPLTADEEVRLECFAESSGAVLFRLYHGCLFELSLATMEVRFIGYYSWPAGEEARRAPPCREVAPSRRCCARRPWMRARRRAAIVLCVKQASCSLITQSLDMAEARSHGSSTTTSYYRCMRSLGLHQCSKLLSPPAAAAVSCGLSPWV